MSMNDFDSVIFDEDEFDSFDDNPQNGGDNNGGDPVSPNQEDNDLTTEVLKLKGIEDPSKIKFEDESGAIVERAWDTLSREEQLNILLDSTETENDLDDSEIQLINNIRQSGLTVQDYLDSIQQPIQIQKEYKVDSLSDEDLYALDLLEKVGSDNISDEEITQAIEEAKKNESLFKKTVEGLRKEYIRLQENEEQQLAQKQALEQQNAYQQFANSIMNEIRGLNSFVGRELELSNDDIEELSSFILDLDDSGMSNFGKAMNDPNLFTKAAFWILNEDKIEEELNRQIQDSYKKGYEAAKQDLGRQNNNNNSSKLVISQTSSKKDQEYVDDEDWF